MKTQDIKSISNNANFQTLMSCYQSNRQNFDYLIRLMHRHVVIPFIGAGFSANFGYPSWGSFLFKQADIHNLPKKMQLTIWNMKRQQLYWKITLIEALNIPLFKLLVIIFTRLSAVIQNWRIFQKFFET